VDQRVAVGVAVGDAVAVAAGSELGLAVTTSGAGEALTTVADGMTASADGLWVGAIMASVVSVLNKAKDAVADGEAIPTCPCSIVQATRPKITARSVQPRQKGVTLIPIVPERTCFFCL